MPSHCECACDSKKFYIDSVALEDYEINELIKIAINSDEGKDYIKVKKNKIAKEELHKKEQQKKEIQERIEKLKRELDDM